MLIRLWNRVPVISGQHINVRIREDADRSPVAQTGNVGRTSGALSTSSASPQDLSCYNTKYDIGYFTLLSIRDNKFKQAQATKPEQAEGTEHVIRQHLSRTDSGYH